MTEKELMKKLAQGMFDRIPDLNDIPPAQEEFSEEHKAKMEKLFAKPQWYMVLSHPKARFDCRADVHHHCRCSPFSQSYT